MTRLNRGWLALNMLLTAYLAYLAALAPFAAQADVVFVLPIFPVPTSQSFLGLVQVVAGFTLLSWAAWGAEYAGLFRTGSDGSAGDGTRRPPVALPPDLRICPSCGARNFRREACRVCGAPLAGQA